MKAIWRTAWQGQDIVVYRTHGKTEEEVGRLHAPHIQRVIFVFRSSGERLSDIRFALVELPEEVVLMPMETGFSGRVHFERQAFWGERANIYWASYNDAPQAVRRATGGWWSRFWGLTYGPIPREGLAAAIDAWTMEGPQTWEQRKWAHIAKNQPFAGFRSAATARSS